MMDDSASLNTTGIITRKENYILLLHLKRGDLFNKYQNNLDNVTTIFPLTILTYWRLDENAGNVLTDHSLRTLEIIHLKCSFLKC